MFSVGKVFLKENLVEVRKCVGVLRSHYLTVSEVNNKNVLKSSEKIVSPNLSLPEIVVPKFEAYKSYTAMVRF